MVKEIAENTGRTEDEVREDIDSGATNISTEAQKAGIHLGLGSDVSETHIINVTSRSFGIIALDNGVEKLYNIIMKNDELPKEASQTFYTVENNQRNVKLSVKESISTEEMIEPELGKDVGDALLDLPPNTPQGAPIEITFRLDESGLLHVRGRELRNNGVVDAEFQTKNAMTQEEVSAAVKRAAESTVQ